MPSGTPGVADFTIFTTRAISNSVRQGVVETLRKDQQLAQFLGATYDNTLHTYGTDGRIFAIPALDILPDRVTPFCCVYCSAEDDTLQINHQFELTVPIIVRMVWDQEEDVLADGASSVEDFFSRVRTVLLSDQRLENTSLGHPGGRGLTDLIAGFQTINYMSQAGNNAGTITCMQEMVVNYRITADALTGALVTQ